MVVSGIIFFLLFLLPFVIAPFGITQFEDPKVVFAEGAIILIFLVALFTNEISFRYRTKQVALFACIVVLTIIDLFFLKTPVSFFGNQFRMQGIFLLWLLLLFSLLIGNIGIQDVEPLQRKVRFLWSGWFFTCLLLTELVTMFFLPLNGSQRYVGTLGEPNALGAFVVFLWPFGWFGFRSTIRGVFGRFLIICVVAIILLMSNSRSAMIAFAIQLLFVFLTDFKRKLFAMQLQLTFKKAAAICFLLFVMSYALPFFQNDPYENRVQIWTSALYAGIISPAIGQGFGNIEVALKNSSAGLALPVQYYYVDSSHNIFLDWWVMGGFIGMSILLYIIYLVSKRFIQDKNSQMFVLLIGMLTILSFNPASVVGLIGFWWIIGRGFTKA